ncbi:hypothetical protein [Parapedobacter deserti]
MHRTISDWGIHPSFVYVCLPILFLAGSITLFLRTSYAPWIYVGIAVLILLQGCDVGRQRFLRQVFDRLTYWRIRILENMLMIAPFLLFLLYRGEAWFCFGLLGMAMAALPLRIGASGSTVLPTPCSGHPFEFAVGFRSSVGLLLIAYVLMVVGIYVGNEKLSIAALLWVVFVCANYYAWCEPLSYVWVYRLTPVAFLWLKVRSALGHLTIVLLPMAAAITCFFPDDWLLVLAASAVGYGYLALAVLAKYAAFPRGVSIPQGIFMAVSFVFPPLLLVSMPYFFRRAKSNIAIVL